MPITRIVLTQSPALPLHPAPQEGIKLKDVLLHPGHPGNFPFMLRALGVRFRRGLQLCPDYLIPYRYGAVFDCRIGINLSNFARDTYTHPIKAASGGKHFVHAKPLLDSMHAAAMRGDTQTTEKLLDKLPRGSGNHTDSSLPVEVYNFLLLAYCRCYPAQLDKSFELINNLVEKKNGLPAPNNLSFELAFNALAKRPDLTTMKKLLELMAECKVPVTHHSYKCAIAVYARINPPQPISVSRLVERMVASGLQPCSKIFMHYLMSHVRTTSPWGSREALDAFTDVRHALRQGNHHHRQEDTQHPAVDLFPNITLTWESYSQALLSCSLADLADPGGPRPPRRRVPAWQTAAELLSDDLGRCATLPIFPQHVEHGIKACVLAGQKAAARKLFESAIQLVVISATAEGVEKGPHFDLHSHANR